ncbi:MAG: carbohydrate ABC transporter substrate-binding protein [Longicatena sp.]
MKKMVALGLCSLLAMGALAGCSKTSKSDSKVLKISGLDGGYKQEGWKKVVAAFEKKEGAKVELRLEKKIADTLRSEVTAGKVPDLIYLSVGAEGGLTDVMVSEKSLEDISGVLDQKVLGEDTLVKDKLIPGVVNGFNTKPYGDGKLYLAPINYGPCGLFYDANLLKTKGWAVPTTWDEMWALGDKAKAEGIALFTYPTTGYFDAFFSALLNETVGPETYEKLMSYDVAAWKLPEVKKAFEIVGKLAEYTEGTTVANANGDNFKKNQQLVLDDKAIFIPNGTWLPGEMKDAPRAKGFEWGFSALPKVDTKGDAYATTFTEQVFVPKDSKNKELAKKFITFLYSDEATKLFYENGGAVMPTKNASKFIKEDDQNKLFYTIYDKGAKADTAGFKVMKNIVEGVNVADANKGVLYATVNSVVNKEKTVDQWYNDTVSAVQKIADANK